MTRLLEFLQTAFTRKARKSDLTLSDRVDRIVTNRWLALPIFILIMYIIYTIAMGSTAVSIGTMGTDWVNDVLFGEWIPNERGKPARLDACQSSAGFSDSGSE